MNSMINSVRLAKRALRFAPMLNNSPTTPVLLSASYHNNCSCTRPTILRPSTLHVSPLLLQSATKKTKGKGGGKAKKGQSGQVGSRLLESLMPDHIDMIELNGRMVGEVSSLSRTLVSINVTSSPSVLASVLVRIGVEQLPVTDLCNIEAEHGKPIILDCSVYPEAKERILEAVRQETAFEAVEHGDSSIKLLSPKLTEALRKRLVTQAKTQANQCNDRLKQMRNEACNAIMSATGRGTSKDTQKKASDNVHQIFLHHKDEVDKVFRAKERSLKDEFNI